MTTTLPPTSPSKRYSEIRSQLSTGDIFLLHGKSPAGRMIEKLEEKFKWPPYSHIGMVIKDVDDLYLWDAPGGGDCFPDPYSSDPDNRTYGWPGAPVHGGCRVSALDDVLAYYATRVDGGGFWLRQLAPAVAPDRFRALRRFINRVDGMPFPAGPGKDPDTRMEIGLGMSWFAGQERASALFGSYFCSQLVADSYMHMGLLEMEVFPPNGYSPAAFGMNDPNRLRLVAPATLGDTIFVDWDRPTQKNGTPCPPPPPPPEAAPSARRSLRRRLSGPSHPRAGRS